MKLLLKIFFQLVCFSATIISHQPIFAQKSLELGVNFNRISRWNYTYLDDHVSFSNMLTDNTSRSLSIDLNGSVTLNNKTFYRLKFRYNLFSENKTYQTDYTNGDQVEIKSTSDIIEIGPLIGLGEYLHFNEKLALFYGLEIPVLLTTTYQNVDDIQTTNATTGDKSSTISSTTRPRRYITGCYVFFGLNYIFHNKITVGTEVASGILYNRQKGSINSKHELFDNNGDLVDTLFETDQINNNELFSSLFVPSIRLTYRF